MTTEEWGRVIFELNARNIRRMFGHGQPMLTVKDDYEDHEAAIESLRKCLTVRRNEV